MDTWRKLSQAEIARREELNALYRKIRGVKWGARV